MAENTTDQSTPLAKEVTPQIPKLPELTQEEIQLAELKLPFKLEQVQKKYDEMGIDGMSEDQKIELAKQAWQRMKTTTEKILKYVDTESSEDWQKFASEY